MLGRYEIRRLIGRGGMGCVYEAIHSDLKKRVAIKTLLPALAASGDARARFLREGESASRIRHPHVVDVTDVGAEGTTSYLVMEYLEGEDLAKLIARQGQLSVAETVDIMLPVAAAIAAAHEMSVVHRDLKPENIFLAKSKLGGVHPKVLDFGISKVTGDRNTMILTGTGATFGTTFYLPPEQLQGARQADAKSDQYALGTILYECLTGRRAFEGENVYGVMKQIAEGRYIPPQARRPDLPDEVVAVVTRAMSLDPNDRFSSVKGLGATLLGFASPNRRVLWEPFFTDAVPEDDGFESLRQPVTGGTMILPADMAAGSRPNRSQPMRGSHTPSPGALSTLSHASGESSRARLSAPISLRPSRAPQFVALGALALAGAVFAFWRYGGTTTTTNATVIEPTVLEPKHEAQPTARRTFRVEIETDPRWAAIELDGRPVGKGALDDRLPVDGTEHVIVARAPGYRETVVRFVDQPPQHLLVLDPNSPAPAATTPAATRERERDPEPAASAARLRHRRGGGAGRVRTERGGRSRGDDAEPAVRTGLSPNGAPIID